MFGFIVKTKCSAFSTCIAFIPSMSLDKVIIMIIIIMVIIKTLFLVGYIFSD